MSWLEFIFYYLPADLKFFSFNNTVKRFDIKFLPELNIFGDF